MNAKQAYLAWLRQTAPAVYAAAVQKVVRQKRSLGGLNRDLLMSMHAPTTGFGFLSDSTSLQPLTFDTSNIVAPADLPTVDTSSFTMPDFSSLDSSGGSSTPASSGGLSSWFNSNTFSSLLGAAASVANTYIASNAQSNLQTSLIQLNTQRAAQGLWPVQANGQPVPQTQLTPSASPSVAQFESAISTGGITTPLLLIAGVGLLAFSLFRRS